MSKVYIIEDLVTGNGSIKITNTLGFVVENIGDTPISIGFNDYSRNIKIEPQNSRTFEVGANDLYHVELYYSTGKNGLLILQTKPLTTETIN